MIKKEIKVMVIDDTIIYRKICKDIANEFDNVRVISTAPNGKIAMRKIRREQPDLVLSDIEMPEMNGLETLKAIKKEFPKIEVIMISGVNQRQANITVKSLSLGALDFIAKPNEKGLEKNYKKLKEDLAPLISLFLKKFNIKASSNIPEPVKKPQKIIPKRRRVRRTTPLALQKFKVIVIGVSTGGPKALGKIIPLLPGDIGIPILIVQHMPPIFTKSLADHLDSKSKLKVVEAINGTRIIKNNVYIAPGGKHMVVRKKNNLPVIGITDGLPVNSCKPAVDVLFKSIPEYYDRDILDIILTGMGSDGFEGIKTLKRYNSYTLTQSEDSCVVYGMPKKVEDENYNDESVHLDNMATRILKLIKK